MRLIDADALMPNAELKGVNCIVTAYDIAKAPTVDAVPVIRCRDCVCWDTSWKPTRAIEGAYWCSNNDIYTESDDYCSLAERKES